MGSASSYCNVREGNRSKFGSKGRVGWARQFDSHNGNTWYVGSYVQKSNEHHYIHKTETVEEK